MIVAIEELSELQKEVCKYLRNAGNYTPDPNPDFDLSHLVEEMADVTVMLEQLRLFLGVNDQVQEQVARKVERLDGRLKESGDWGG